MTTPDNFESSGRPTPEMVDLLGERVRLITQAALNMERVAVGAQPVASGVAKFALADQTESVVQQDAAVATDPSALARALAVSAEITKQKLL